MGFPAVEFPQQEDWQLQQDLCFSNLPKPRLIRRGITQLNSPGSSGSRGSILQQQQQQQ